MIITVEMIKNWSPDKEYGYTENKVRDIIGTGKTPLEICELDISVEFKIFILLRKEIISIDKEIALNNIFAMEWNKSGSIKTARERQLEQIKEVLIKLEKNA